MRRRDFLKTSVSASLSLAVGVSHAGPATEPRTPKRPGTAGAETAIEIGTRIEMFVDRFLIEETRNTELRLQQPERREISFLCDADWEDDVAGFYRVLEDPDGTVRLYYRAAIPERTQEHSIVSAMAISTDGGITFTRPDLGLVEYRGSRRNNILSMDRSPLDSPPPCFLDTHPDCQPDERYKGLTTQSWKLYALGSPDGLRWRPLSREPIEMPGLFDTVNTAFWDARSNCYRSYTRSWLDAENGYVPVQRTEPNCVRAIQTATSQDFIHWTEPVQLVYQDGDLGTHMYTNAVLPCPGAEHIYVGFPNRYVPERKVDLDHPYSGVNDAVFMSSRDGVHWHRFPEAWVRPGLDPLNWTERNNYPTWGIVRTSPSQWSMYISEHYRHPGTPCRLRRLAIRPHGFVSIHAGGEWGECLTKPLLLGGDELRLNFSTSAIGSVQVEVQHPDGTPVPGFGMDEMAPLYGDELDRPIRWKGTKDLSGVIGKPVRLRFRLRDADLFAFRTVLSEDRVRK